MRCAVKASSPSDERSAGNRHATFCGSRGRFVAPGDPVMTPSAIGEGHQSGNVGKHPSEVVWVILKK